MHLYINRFITGELQSWGSWLENLGSWLGARFGSRQFLLLRYEDLLSNTVDQLSMVADFLKIPSSNADLVRTIELSSAERMRILEKTEGDDWATIKGGRGDVPFIGKAVSGQWKTELSSHAAYLIESAWGECMVKLGYELTYFQVEREAAPRGGNIGRRASLIPRQDLAITRP